MAGLSLKCGDCGTLLKSVEEAQEHAELTKHANFVESTEAVLNVVCSDCGKPCRSQTEIDLHTKRTGHTGFEDKTSETAKPISLEAPKPNEDVEMLEADNGSSSQQEEMVVPEVNQQLLAELEEMGFSKERATRALHFSGNVDLETAANWVVEHEDDPDIDIMPLVPVSSNKPAAPTRSLTPEEIKQKQQELRERARKKKEEEEKRMEREREKERIRIGRELLEAKRIEEDNERKRLLALRKAEKEEEKRAREKICQKLEEDKEKEDLINEVAPLTVDLQQERDDHDRLLLQVQALSSEVQVRDDRIQVLSSEVQVRDDRIQVLSSEVQVRDDCIQVLSSEVLKYMEDTEKTQTYVREMETTCLAQSHQIRRLQEALSLDQNKLQLPDMSLWEAKKSEFEDQKALILDLKNRLADAELKVLEGERVRKKQLK